MTRANLVEHLEHSCKFRMEKCEYCHSLVENACMEVDVKLFYKGLLLVCLFVLLLVFPSFIF